MPKRAPRGNHEQPGRAEKSRLFHGTASFDWRRAPDALNLHAVSYTVFARKYRPQKFDDVLGQEHITTTLRNAIEQRRIAHAYIFVGPRGTGKTSTARIFAMALNCTGGPKADFGMEDDLCSEIAQGRSLDVIEIDGASNNGVEQVRELREHVRFAPARGRYKIYIIDEVHMLSTAAFNALLKTLEEPPAHAIFLMATTDVQKVLPTILSRCQRFDLRRIPTATIAKHLLWIAGQEKFVLEPAAAAAIARGAEGGLRDAESMLDQLVAFCGDMISEADVLQVFGFTSRSAVAGMSDAILSADAADALRLIHEHSEAGKDLGRLMSDLISHLRDILVIKADPDAGGGELMQEDLAMLRGQADRVDNSRLLDLIEQFAAAEGRMKWAPNKRMHFEVAVIRAVQTLQSATLTEVLDALTAIRGGQPPPAQRAIPPPAPRPAPAPPPAKAAPKPAAVEPTPVVRETPAPDPGTFWPALVAAVRRDRKLISAWLEAGSLLGIEGGVVQLGFPPGQEFARDLLEQGHLAFLGECASAILGQPASVRLQVREGVVSSPVATPAEAPPEDPMEAFKADPLIRKAMDIFKAEISAT